MLKYYFYLFCSDTISKFVKCENDQEKLGTQITIKITVTFNAYPDLIFLKKSTIRGQQPL